MNNQVLTMTGEREIPIIPGTLEGIDIKHLERYTWASIFAHKKNVYDIACGCGYGSLLLKAASYTGFDNSAETIRYARKYYSGNFIQADACNLSQNIKKTDIIISFETIEHIKEPEYFVGWSAKHCDTFIISTPLRGSYRPSRFHLFEFRLVKFKKLLQKYFSRIDFFIQKDGIGIVFPLKEEDKGVAIAVCR